MKKILFLAVLALAFAPMSTGPVGHGQLMAAWALDDGSSVMVFIDPTDTGMDTWTMRVLEMNAEQEIIGEYAQTTPAEIPQRALANLCGQYVQVFSEYATSEAHDLFHYRFKLSQNYGRCDGKDQALYLPVEAR